MILPIVIFFMAIAAGMGVVAGFMFLRWRRNKRLKRK